MWFLVNHNQILQTKINSSACQCVSFSIPIFWPPGKVGEHGSQKLGMGHDFALVHGHRGL